MAVFLGWAMLASVFGCSPDKAKGRLESPPSSAKQLSDGPLTFYVLPDTSEMEERAFGVDLHDDKQMAVELRIDSASTDGATPMVVLYRHDVQLVFSDGTRRYPIDPMKVYEKNRVNRAATAGATMGGALAFGLVGAVVAYGVASGVATTQDDNRHQTLTIAGLDEVRLNQHVSSVTGFLFFDLAGIERAQARSLLIQYEDASSAVHAVEIQL